MGWDLFRPRRREDAYTPMLRQFVTLSCLLFLATWPVHGADEAAPESSRRLRRSKPLR